MLIEGPLKGAPSRSTAWFDAVAVLRCLIGGPLWGSYSWMNAILAKEIPRLDHLPKQVISGLTAVISGFNRGYKRVNRCGKCSKGLSGVGLVA